MIQDDWRWWHELQPLCFRAQQMKWSTSRKNILLLWEKPCATWSHQRCASSLTQQKFFHYQTPNLPLYLLQTPARPTKHLGRRLSNSRRVRNAWPPAQVLLRWIHHFLLKPGNVGRTPDCPMCHPVVASSSEPAFTNCRGGFQVCKHIYVSIASNPMRKSRDWIRLCNRSRYLNNLNDSNLLVWIHWDLQKKRSKKVRKWLTPSLHLSLVAFRPTKRHMSTDKMMWEVKNTFLWGLQTCLTPWVKSTKLFTSMQSLGGNEYSLALWVLGYIPELCPQIKPNASIYI